MGTRIIPEAAQSDSFTLLFSALVSMNGTVGWIVFGLFDWSLFGFRAGWREGWSAGE